MMRTLDKWSWVALALMSGAAFVAVVAFGWTPSPKQVNGSVFASLCWVARARWLLLKINAE